MTRLSAVDVTAFLSLQDRWQKFLDAEKASFVVQLKLDGAKVPPGSKEARLKLSLNSDPRDTVVGSWASRNGIGTNLGTNSPKGIITFHPGDPIGQEIVFPLKGTEAIGSTYEVILSGTISGASVVLPAIVKIEISNEQLAPVPSGFRLAYEDNFVDGFEATDSGLKADGSPCWYSRLNHGRTQPGNKELGLYVDPVLHPGTDPFPIVDGKRRLRSEKLVAPITFGGQPWNYTASVITSKRLKALTAGNRVECRLAMPVLGSRGAWPAFWLLPTSGAWPPEIDMMEWPIKNDANAWTYYSTQHWTGGTRGYPIDIRTLGITEDLTNFHTYGITLTEETITFDIDGHKTAVMENRSPTQTWYVLLNMAFGGSWPGNPTAETRYPNDMILDWIKFYEPA